MGKHTIEQKNYHGLEYVTVKMDADGFDETYGPLYSSKLIARIDRLVAMGILEGCYPLRGKEVKFIRGTLGLSVRALADALGVTHPTVASMEKEADKRISRQAEAYLKLYFYKELGISKVVIADLLPQDDVKIKPLKVKIPA